MFISTWIKKFEMIPFTWVLRGMLSALWVDWSEKGFYCQVFLIYGVAGQLVQGELLQEVI